MSKKTTLYSVHDRSKEVSTAVSTKQRYQLHCIYITTGIYTKKPQANLKVL
jgi:hypothetical protein